MKNKHLRDLGGAWDEGPVPRLHPSHRAGEPKPRARSLFLIHPPQQGLLEGFSSSLIALSAHVRAEIPNIEVKLLDLGLADWNEVERLVRECVDEAEGQVFVGLTTTTSSYQAALRVARNFKLLAPDSVLILGGHHASAQDEAVLSHLSIDLVVRGEGEVALVKLLESYPDLSVVPNLSYRRGQEVVRNHRAPLLSQHELDAARVSSEWLGQQSAPGKFDRTTYVSARGCPLQCAFCSVANEKIRNKSIGAVVEDLRALVGKMGFASIAIEDNFFAHSPRRTIALCRAIEQLQKELPFSWDCQTRVESCSREDVLMAMERAGCEAVYLGVEACDPEHLLYLGKTRRPGEYLRTLRKEVVPRLLQSRMDCYFNLQLGLPGESKHHRENTLLALRVLGRMAAAHGKTITLFPQLHVVYPGTAHLRQAVIEGRFGPGADLVFERFTEWESRHEPILRWLGEHFAHGTGGIPEGILRSDRLREGEFEVNSKAVFEVINYLSAMTGIEGIRVFQYGRYLAGHTEVQPETRIPDVASPWINS